MEEKLPKSLRNKRYFVLSDNEQFLEQVQGKLTLSGINPNKINVANNPIEAIKFYEFFNSEIDIVILDEEFDEKYDMNENLKRVDEEKRKQENYKEQKEKLTIIIKRPFEEDSFIDLLIKKKTEKNYAYLLKKEPNATEEEKRGILKKKELEDMETLKKFFRRKFEENQFKANNKRGFKSRFHVVYSIFDKIKDITNVKQLENLVETFYSQSEQTTTHIKNILRHADIQTQNNSLYVRRNYKQYLKLKKELGDSFVILSSGEKYIKEKELTTYEENYLNGLKLFYKDIPEEMYKKINIDEKKLHDLLKEHNKLIVLAAFFHDIGKNFIESKLLDSEKTFNAEEKAIMNNHVKYGSYYLDILIDKAEKDLLRTNISEEQAKKFKEKKFFFEKIKKVIDEHHGKNDIIDNTSKFVKVIDIMEAMFSQRSYKEAKTIEETFKEVFQKELVEIPEFLRVFKIKCDTDENFKIKIHSILKNHYSEFSELSDEKKYKKFIETLKKEFKNELIPNKFALKPFINTFYTSMENDKNFKLKFSEIFKKLKENPKDYEKNYLELKSLFPKTFFEEVNENLFKSIFSKERMGNEDFSNKIESLFSNNYTNEQFKSVFQRYLENEDTKDFAFLTSLENIFSEKKMNITDYGKKIVKIMEGNINQNELHAVFLDENFIDNKFFQFSNKVFEENIFSVYNTYLNNIVLNKDYYEKFLLINDDSTIFDKEDEEYKEKKEKAKVIAFHSIKNIIHNLSKFDNRYTEEAQYLKQFFANEPEGQLNLTKGGIKIANTKLFTELFSPKILETFGIKVDKDTDFQISAQSEQNTELRLNDYLIKYHLYKLKNPLSDEISFKMSEELLKKLKKITSGENFDELNFGEQEYSFYKNSISPIYENEFKEKKEREKCEKEKNLVIKKER